MNLQDLSLHSWNIIISSLHCLLFITLQYHQTQEVTICHKISMPSDTHDSCEPSTATYVPGEVCCQRAALWVWVWWFAVLLRSSHLHLVQCDGAGWCNSHESAMIHSVLCTILYQNAEHLGNAGLFRFSTYNKHGTPGSKYYLHLESSL
jgi:hypothetical protein